MRSFIRKVFYTVLVIGAVSFVLAKRFGGNISLSSHKDHSTYEGFSSLKSEGESFSQVNLHGNFHVILKDASSHSYSVDAHGNPEDKIRAYISDEVLHVHYKGKKWFHSGTKNRVEIEISSPELSRIEAHGAVRLETANTLEYDRLEINMSGASEGELELDTDNLELKGSGASDLELKGEATYADLSVSGAGEIDAEELESETVRVSISGAGEAKVHATDKLDVRVSGAGSVRYKGDPNEVSKHISGAGSVKKMR